MEECQKCKEVDYDRRSLWMSCFYSMEELGLPFTQLAIEDKKGMKNKFYTLRVCKNCRSDWMNAIKDWFNRSPVNRECGSGIWIRDLGAIKEITEEEWHKICPDREPVKFVGDKS